MRELCKRCASVLMALLCLLPLAACGEDPVAEAENTAAALFVAVKKLDAEAFVRYADVTVPPEMDIQNADIERVHTAVKPYLDKLKYEILSGEQTDDGAVALRVRTTAPELQPLLTSLASGLFTQTLPSLWSGDQLTAEGVAQTIERVLNEADLTVVTAETDLTMLRQPDGSWKAQAGLPLIGTLTGTDTGILEELVSAVQGLSD